MPKAQSHSLPTYLFHFSFARVTTAEIDRLSLKFRSAWSNKWFVVVPQYIGFKLQLKYPIRLFGFSVPLARMRQITVRRALFDEYSIEILLLPARHSQKYNKYVSLFLWCFDLGNGLTELMSTNCVFVHRGLLHKKS